MLTVICFTAQKTAKTAKITINTYTSTYKTLFGFFSCLVYGENTFSSLPLVFSSISFSISFTGIFDVVSKTYSLNSSTILSASSPKYF